MGGFDIFCFICGNSCHGMNQDLVEMLIDNVCNDENKKMLTEDTDTIEKISSLIKTTKWMNNCTMLTIDNRIIHNCEENSYDGGFEDSKNNFYTHLALPDLRSPLDNSYGVFLHTDCWKYIYNKYNFKLKFSDLPIVYSDNLYKIFDFINYGDIEKYWSQDFDFINIIIDKKEYLCSSPLLHDKNESIIIKNFNELKIRTKGDRKSPNVSATQLKNGTIKIGTDNNFWIIKNNKWILLNEQIKTITITTSNTTKNKFIDDLKFIGESSFDPVFIKSIDVNENICYIKLLIAESFIANISNDITNK
jgi:hypothetical protein